ncbi:short chain dehydrogenase [Vibrio penaeicida]|uniref:short chain dehydrogenase n=1 Tax=Vibrio penaeicida TaxID=104609 RepID=UPI002735E900|nr:short chain dehydrogenase [Vibrio penaeicida]MDP2572502.1 short chain dehydrogenase [Vibrio penaeicida]
MKIIVIGANGIVGHGISKHLGKDHDIVAIGHTKGALRADIESEASLTEVFEKIGLVDAIICAAGNGSLGTLSDMPESDYRTVLDNKVLGQVNVAKVGRRFLKPEGSITLTSGATAQKPIEGSIAIGMGCAAIEAFVRSAALELPKGQRINVVSPGFIKESMEQLGIDSQYGVPAEKVAMTYLKSAVGSMTGEVLAARL